MYEELEEYAFKNNVPIMQKESIEYISNIIRTYNIKTILEIGTAIGYSTIKFASVNESINITSIEKNNERYLIALKNIKDFNMENRINLVFNDALNIETKDKFDLLIIDAAKSKNIEFFNKFKDNINSKGFIIIDNINFHGFVGHSDTIESENLKRIVKKIEKSIEFLKSLNDFKVEFVNVGDGLAICQKIN